MIKNVDFDKCWMEEENYGKVILNTDPDSAYEITNILEESGIDYSDFDLQDMNIGSGPEGYGFEFNLDDVMN
ncbi:MAG: hypothetical protein QNK33_01580 [Bacteroidales bacterium]|nr:hypothetical protein [Bacteroidales bacterium]